MSAALDLRSKEEKDAELDKRIEALHKKNEALIKRYQEIEEDRKKAEQEGMAVTALRRARPPDPKSDRRFVDKDLSVTVQEKRVVKDKKPPNVPKLGRGAALRNMAMNHPPGRPSQGDYLIELFWEGVTGDDVTSGDRGGPWGQRARGRGLTALAMADAGSDRKTKEWEERRRQNIEKMNKEMEKIAEYEKNQRDGLHEKNPVRNFLDDPRRSGPFQDADRKEGSRRHVRNWGGPDFDKVKAGMEREKTSQGTVRTPGRRSSPKTKEPLDMTLSMTGRERAEYMRWKKEREQIDQERLARQRKPTGQWRREWDAEKSDSMFKDGFTAAPTSEEEHRRPPPKPPTFGEFLTPQPTQKRRKNRRRPQTSTSKSYSMHDNRWEEEQQQQQQHQPLPEKSQGREAEAAPSDPLPPPLLSASSEEDEGQWEDLSEDEEEEEEEEDEEEEEEEEEEAEGAQTLTEDAALPSASPKPQQPPKTGQPPVPNHHGTPPTVPPSPGWGAAPPFTPLSPLERHQPVCDWAEEMELASPRSPLGDNPLLGPIIPKSKGDSGVIPGLNPVDPTSTSWGVQPPNLGVQPSNLGVQPPNLGVQPPQNHPPGEEAASNPIPEQETPRKTPLESGIQGLVVPPDEAPVAVEIADFQRVRFHKH